MKKLKWIMRLAIMLMAAIAMLSLGSCSNPSGSDTTGNHGSTDTTDTNDDTTDDEDDGEGENDDEDDDEPETPEEVFFEGKGILGDPFIIDSLEALLQMRELVNEGDIEILNPYRGAHYKQTVSIDMDNMEWESIGTSTNTFLGVYDGGNYTISNLKATGSDKGLFGYVGDPGGNSSGAVIMNVRLSNLDIDAVDSAGGITGTLHDGTIKNCRVSGGTITANGEYCGGIAAYIGMESLVENCYVSAITIKAPSGSSSAGGLAGFNFGGTIRNCYTTADVSGKYYSGGITGYNYGLIEHCYAAGDVTNTDTTSGSGLAGGLAGYMTAGTVQNCIAFNKNVRAGGTAGRVAGEKIGGTLRHNYARYGMYLTVGNTLYTPGYTGDPIIDAASKDGLCGTNSAWNSIISGQDFLEYEENWYEEAWDFTTIWKMGAQLPILQSFGSDVQDPRL